MSGVATVAKPRIPRNFKLLEEYDAGNNGTYKNISYGLVDPTDTFMTKWTGLIIHNNGKTTTVEIETGMNYPDDPPKITLIDTDSSKVQALFINKNLPKEFEAIKSWNPDKTIAYILETIHRRA